MKKMLLLEAENMNEITIFGENQLRPNIHIQDMIRTYELFIDIDFKKINKKYFQYRF